MLTRVVLQAFRAARRATKRVLARYTLAIEYCDDCGVTQPMVWTSSDQLWAEVSGRTGGGGVLCPSCFDRRAQALGLLLRWEPRVDTRRIVRELLATPEDELVWRGRAACGVCGSRFEMVPQSYPMPYLLHICPRPFSVVPGPPEGPEDFQPLRLPVTWERQERAG